MAIKIKAIERLQKIGKYADTYRYQMQPDLYSSLTQEKVIREAALRSGVSEGVMHACWDAAGEVIKAWATEGHSVALPGLGSMRFGLSAQTVADVNDVKANLIKTRRIIFSPAVELKEELKNTSVIITCYDRNGEIVKRVTSTDDGTVEDTENGGGTTENGSTDSGNSGTTNPTNGENQGGSGTNTGGDNGGGDEGGGMGQN
jgi:predicted histone-like DNA-binding protein